MKSLEKILFVLCASAFMLSCAEKATPQDERPPHSPKEEVTPDEPNEPGQGEMTSELKVMSFNVRYPASSDTGEQAWSYRLTGVKAMLDAKKPDVIGTQECYPSQRTDMLNHLKGYKYYGVLRSNGKDEDAKAETTSIIYNGDKLELVSSGTFWLSETPEEPSTGWGATIKRSTTWILFKEKSTGKMFYHVNTHLDHASSQAQIEGAKLIRQRIDQMNTQKYPVVLTGDMNVPQNSTACAAFAMKNARTEAPKTDVSLTCHGYGSKYQQIDHIFYEGCKAEVYETVKGPWANMTYISDHHPVMAVLKY